MSMFDKFRRKAKKMASDHPDKINKGLGKVGDIVDKRTGGKYSDKIDKGEEAAGEYVRKTGEGDTAR
jgi:hypothetical protein